jgi:D-lactate dehydrogenase (cytochrome)
VVNVIQGGHQPEAMELLDERIIKAMDSGGYYDEPWPEKPTIFLKLSGRTEDTVRDLAAVASDLAKAAGSTSFNLSKDADERERKSMVCPEDRIIEWAGLERESRGQVLVCDACVLISRLGEIIERMHNMINESKMWGMCLGHVGDGKPLLSFSSFDR